MSDPQVPNGGAADAPVDVNKRTIWSLWHKSADWQQELYRKAAHKSLDIPDPMNINNTTTKSGIGTLGAVGIAAMSGLPAIALAGYMLWKDAKPAAPQTTPPPFSVNDSEYDVLFYDKDGNPINVPHISTRKVQ